MPTRGKRGADDQLYDTSWIDGMVDDATARIEADEIVVPASPAATTPVSTAPAQQVAAPLGDSLAEVSWVDAPVVPEAPPIAAPPVQSPAQTAPVVPEAPVAPPIVPEPAPVARSVSPARPAVARPNRTVQPEHEVVAPLQPEPSTRVGTQVAAARQDVVTTEVEELRWRDLDQQSTTISSSNTPARTSGSSASSFLREWAPVAIGALIVAVLLRTFVVQAFEIPSESMLPTLETDDRIVVNQMSYTFGDISRGEVVVFERPPSMPAGPDDAEYLVKRVIGLPGDEIRLFEGEVWINSERLVEDDYIFEESSSRPTNVTIPGCEGGGSADFCLVPDGFVFVLGDNRFNSTDSRVAGPIDADLVVGRAVIRAWPLNALSWL